MIPASATTPDGSNLSGVRADSFDSQSLGEATFGIRVNGISHEPLLLNLSALKGLSRILVVGGSFDPFTRAHLETPEQAAKLIGAEAILYIPARHNPLKSSETRASPVDRLWMIREALTTKLNAYVSPIELLRNGDSFTVDTLKQIKSELGPETEICMFLGSDCIKQLPAWRAVDEVMQLARIIPSTRGEEADAVLSTLAGSLKPEQIETLRSEFLNLNLSSASATQARELLGQGILPWRELPPAVVKYIEERGLYGYRPSQSRL